MAPTIDYLDVVRQDGSRTGFVLSVPPPDELYGVALHDYEVYPMTEDDYRKLYGSLEGFPVQGMSRPEYNQIYSDGTASTDGLPETIRLLNSVDMPLTRSWQFALRDHMLKACLVAGMPDNAATLAFVNNAFRSVLRDNGAFSNKMGSTTRADYVNGTNLDQGPIKVATAITAGAYLKVLHGGVVEDIRGKLGIAVQTLDGNKPPPPLDAFDPHVENPNIFFAVNSLRLRLPDTTPRCDPFGQLGGLNVPFFVMGDGPINYIPANRLRLLPPGAPVPSPYNPTRP